MADRVQEPNKENENPQKSLKNIEDGFGRRYLQNLIRKLNAKNCNLALRFITNASMDEINAQEEENGSTALDVALEKLELINKSKRFTQHEEFICQYIFRIIEALEKRGASKNITNSLGEKRSHELMEIVKKRRETYLQHPPSSPEKKQDPTSNVRQARSGRLRLKSLFALSIVGVVACYFGYKILKGKNTKLK